MRNFLLMIAIPFVLSSLYGQETEGKFLKDGKTGCTVWFKYYAPDDSVTWSGNCKNNMADGYGTMKGFSNGKETSRYTGIMLNGKPHGKGKLSFAPGRKLEGNFSYGEILNLKESCLKRLEKNTVVTADSANSYVGDNNAKQLYYHALIPNGKINGTVVLMPGTWETTEHLLSSTQKLCEMAFDNHLAVVVPSINQRLTLTDEVLNIMNTMFTHALSKYNLPKDKFVIGGWSMGGLFSLRYTEMANQNIGKTVIKPKAVFSADGPVDLETIYKNFQKKLKKNPNNNESAYGIREMEKHTGGTPAQSQSNYVSYSAFSLSQENGGNAQYLKNTPVRIYDDVDVNWWLDNRNVDMYDLNALDQSAMILQLKEMGNDKAEFINAFGKGWRIEGNRHPHSWSIVDATDCINWIIKCLQ